jgi:NADPH-dependent ferric siderophore reductase
MNEISTVARPIVRLTVSRVTRIAPRMIRMVAGGSAVRQFEPGPFTDTYVRLLFPPPGVTYPDELDIRGIRATMPRARWPRVRTYTVRSLDPAARELSIDFVDHGRPGLTPSWLDGLRPGDPVLTNDMRGRYRPGPEADWHLLVGDATALPAIARTLEAMAPGTRARVLLEVEDAADERQLSTVADADVRWLHRARAESLTEAVRALAFERGVVQAFVHGEAGAMQRLRRILVRERGVPEELLSISGYWRRGLNDEQWRARKAAGSAD